MMMLARGCLYDWALIRLRKPIPVALCSNAALEAEEAGFYSVLIIPWCNRYILHILAKSFLARLGDKLRSFTH